MASLQNDFHLTYIEKYCDAGAQQGIFEARSLINNKGHNKLFLEKMHLEIIFFRFMNKWKLCSKFRDFIASMCSKKIRSRSTQ